MNSENTFLILRETVTTNIISYRKIKDHASLAATNDIAISADRKIFTGNKNY